MTYTTMIFKLIRKRTYFTKKTLDFYEIKKEYMSYAVHGKTIQQFVDDYIGERDFTRSKHISESEARQQVFNFLKTLQEEGELIPVVV